MDGIFYTVDQFAKRLKVHPQTIRKAIKENRLYAFRPGVGKKAPFRIHESEYFRIMNADFESIQRAHESI